MIAKRDLQHCLYVLLQFVTCFFVSFCGFTVFDGFIFHRCWALSSCLTVSCFWRFHFFSEFNIFRRFQSFDIVFWVVSSFICDGFIVYFFRFSVWRFRLIFSVFICVAEQRACSVEEGATLWRFPVFTVSGCPLWCADALSERVFFFCDKTGSLRFNLF